MSIYQHFRPEEKEFIDLVLNWKRDVEETYTQKLSDFLDPREQTIMQSIIGQDGDCRVAFFGGKNSCERKRAYLYPYFVPVTNEDFQITLYEIEYPDKFISLSHPEVLGSLMGLGLRRGKFGDILVKDKRIQFFTSKEIAEYVQLHFHSVGRTTITVIKRPIEEAIDTSDEMILQETTISSLRVDTVLSAVSKLSRQKAKMFIQQGYLKVNWELIEDPSYLLEEGDVLSARGMGRIVIKRIGDKTKKDKWRITVGKIK